MDFETKIYKLQDTVEKYREHLTSERGTIDALVRPFLQALGYDTSNPIEVKPEHDPGKFGRKVDYAIFVDGKIRMSIECKSADTVLNHSHWVQLFQYFAFENARLAILTNGVVYQFYSDLDADNKMDTKPFFTFNMSQVEAGDICILEQLAKDKFDIDNIVRLARNRKTQELIRSAVEKELSQPSEEFVRLILRRVGVDISDSEKSDYTDLAASTIRETIREMTNGESSPTPTPTSLPVHGKMPEDREAFLASPLEGNGQKRPTQGKAAISIWLLCNKFHNEYKRAPTRKEIREISGENGFKPERAGEIRRRWLRYHGLYET